MVLQCVFGLDAAIPHLALLKELLAHYVLLSYILIKIFFKGCLVFLFWLKNCLEVGRLHASISVNGSESLLISRRVMSIFTPLEDIPPEG